MIFSISLIVIAVAIMAIVYFVPKYSNHSSGANTQGGGRTVSIQVTAHDIEIIKGQKFENFYTVSNKDALITFEIDKAELVEIEGDNITALKQGETNIKIIAEEGNEKDSCTIKVKISADKYAAISANSNCTILNDIIYTESSVCSIKIEFFDNYGNPINSTYSIICDDATVKFKKRSSEVIIMTDHSVVFSISFDNGEVVQSVQVVYSN